MSTTATEAGRFLTFTLHGESYALDIFHVTDIIEYRQLTAVPMAPDFVRGVINLRGRAVPVIDLGIRFGQGATAAGRGAPASSSCTAATARTAPAEPGDVGQQRREPLHPPEHGDMVDLEPRSTATAQRPNRTD